MYRLKMVAPDLARQLIGLAPAVQLLVARGLAHWVLVQPGLENPAAIAYLSAAVDDPVLRDTYADILEAEAQRMDQAGWDVQDASNGSLDDATELAYRRAYCLARSLAAAAFALHEDPEVAVLESAFEVQAAVGDVEPIRAEVSRMLGR